MKVYKSKYDNFIIFSHRGSIEFVNGKFVAKTKREIDMIEKNDGFGLYIFEDNNEEAVKVVPEEVKDDVSSFVCKECGASFASKRALNGHMLSHRKK